eukprot:1158915-Pelagomonas_calceolata.AAC.4
MQRMHDQSLIATDFKINEVQKLNCEASMVFARVLLPQRLESEAASLLMASFSFEDSCKDSHKRQTETHALQHTETAHRDSTYYSTQRQPCTTHAETRHRHNHNVNHRRQHEAHAYKDAAGHLPDACEGGKQGAKGREWKK